MTDNNALHAALAKAQGEFLPIVKDRMNPHFKAAYATLASMIDATRPALATNGLAVTQLFLPSDNGLTLITRLLHTSGAMLESSIPLFNATKGAQVFGSEVTYMRRYSYAAILNIVADDEDDGNEAQKAGAAKSIRPTPMRPTHPQQPIIDDEIPARVMDAPPKQTVRDRLRAAVADVRSTEEVDAVYALDWVKKALQFAPDEKKMEMNQIISDAYKRAAAEAELGAANEPH